MDITFKDVSYIYQKNTPFEHQALKNISFHIPSGKFVAIIGHTGSGKSTLIQHLNGLLIPTSGEISIGDFVLNKEKKLKEMKQLRSKVGIAFQYPEHQLFEENVKKDIAFGPENFGVNQEEIEKRIKKAIERVGFPEDLLTRSPFELSGGQMRRVAIAGVLAIEPDIYILDEPTAGLDPQGQKDVMDMFYHMHQEEKTTTILVTHNMEDALRYADYIIILNKGEKYLEGTPDDIFYRKKAIRRVQLEVPETIRFMEIYNEKMGTNLPITKHSVKEIAQQIAGTLGVPYG